MNLYYSQFDLLTEWQDSWQLNINLVLTKIMHFSKKNHHLPVDNRFRRLYKVRYWLKSLIESLVQFDFCWLWKFTVLIIRGQLCIFFNKYWIIYLKTQLNLWSSRQLNEFQRTFFQLVTVQFGTTKIHSSPKTSTQNWARSSHPTPARSFR